VALRKFSVLGLMFSAIRIALTPAAADEINCPASRIVVMTSGQDVSRAKVCAPAVWARAFFERCGIIQRRKLTLEIVNRVTHPLGVPVIATFDATRWRARISNFEATLALILPKSVYRKLPFRDVYDSLVVHEVAHAIFREHVGGRRIPVTAHEYVAYAIQIASMPQETRDLLLSSFPLQTSKDLARFNDIYLAMRPLRFAANAYRHLFRNERYCETIARIASGDAEFPLPLE
jgi:hypothetical protein